MTGQYKFKFDLDGNINGTEAVASKAHERGSKEKQWADLFQHQHEHEAMKLWQSVDYPPTGDTDE